MEMEIEDGRDWSQLSSDLLISVAQYLHLADVARLSAVCGGWAWALAGAPSGWPPPVFRATFNPLEKSPPWLLLPNKNGDEAGYCDFLCPDESESGIPRIRISLPEMAGRICVGGSPDGWIVTVDVWLSPRILNPLTGEEFSLPSLGTLSRYNKMSPVYSQEEDGSVSMIDFKFDLFDLSFEEFKYKYVQKIILSSAPPHCIAFLIHGPDPNMSQLAMARIGDLAWSPALGIDYIYDHIEDVVYNEKDRKFYVVSLGGKLIILDLKNYHWGSSQPPEAILLGSMPNCLPGRKYVVFSSGGDLLQVWRQYEDDDFSCDDDDDSVWSTDVSTETLCIKVFKFDPEHYDGENPASCWVHVMDLGDEAIFLGSSHSICVPTSEKPWIRRNSVYFAEDRILVRLEPQVYHARAGIFDLRNNKVERFFPSDSKVLLQPPAWFIPLHL